MGAGGFFREVNRRALEGCDRWVRALFPTARWQTNNAAPPGMWRVASADLGRAHEEDLSIHPRAGIHDFGPRVGMTPIDVVVEFGAAADAKAAAFWLCEQLGVGPEDCGWRSGAEQGRADPGATQETPRPARPLPLHPLILDDERLLPERRWVGGAGAFPRPRLACLAGPPGVSKTTLAVAISVALAVGKPYGGLVEPDGPCRALLGCIEDEIAEVRRRGHAIAAALAGHPDERARVNANLALVDLADRVPLFTVTPDGRLTETEGAAMLRATIKAHRPDIVVLDPLIELHTAEEGSNTLMRPVLRALRSLAAEFDCVVLLLHHETKAGDGSPLQRLRGAGAIGGAIRALWSMRAITAEEAKEHGVAEDMTDLFVKVETGKSQYSRRRPPAWFAVEERQLANGDAAHVLTPWSPPSVAVSPEMLAAGLRALREGLHGEPCSTSPAAQAAARVALERAGVPRSCCAQVLERLLASGEAVLRPWRDPAARKLRKRIWTEGNAFEGWAP